MQIEFDRHQDYQLDAVQAIIDVFDGQPLAQGEHEASLSRLGGQLINELAFGNQILLSPEAVLENVQTIQKRNRIQPVDELKGMNFSIEMETGTGKTYVYVRTLHELHRRYGFTKFVIVVPNIAIREGVITALESMKEHMAELYSGTPLDFWTYQSKRPSTLRQFATSNQIQILILNVDAFNKPENNIIHQEQDRLAGRKPIEFIQATHPVVIVDEPQNMEATAARSAIESLNPGCTLRYSATHREFYNLLYRLDPIAAYDMNLVKRIEVSSVREEENFNAPYIELKAINPLKRSIKATLKIDIDRNGTISRRQVRVSDGDDLFDISGGRNVYSGYIVSEIDADQSRVVFSNGASLLVGQSQGGQTDEMMAFQIRDTVREHLEKELRFSRLPMGERIKVLSLFFIDRVANYAPQDGKLRRFFHEAYEELRSDARYSELPLPTANDAQASYFAMERGEARDTQGKSKSDSAAYALIMRNKVELLAFTQPVRFIFTHSALREGWDNPNVFQICTLNETRSEPKKRQEIGRGLRLPLKESGARSFDPEINRLTIFANESYDEFARGLQKEIEDETGVSFAGRIQNKRERQRVALKEGWNLNEDFVELWSRIKPLTRYRVEFQSTELIEEAARHLASGRRIRSPRFVTSRAALGLSDAGVQAELRFSHIHDSGTGDFPIPDLIGYLQRETELTRQTIVGVLIASGRLAEVKINPQMFLDQALLAIRTALLKQQVAGIKYERVDGEEWRMSLFEEREIESYVSKLLAVGNSIYSAIPFDSKTERTFAMELDTRNDIKFLLKLPSWFKVQTPLGTYNPDWAIVKVEPDGQEKLYLVRETKSTDDTLRLRGTEQGKILCGEAHFNSLNVNFAVARTSSDI